ncbi:MAG TPA: acyl-CoA dehydrogenase family protein [Acetobacteraceae bacterium]|nr:acyl-CoA dehydrogenase family protein [Acetobacteraceae bacterium]
MLESTDPNALVVETARRFAQEKLAPTAAAREQAGAIEKEIIEALGEMGFLGATNSAEWGGSEIPYEAYAQVVEEIAAGDGSVSTLVSVHNAPTCEILEKFGTPEQKERWLRPLASGQAVGSFALTEPSAGSDASGVRTRAVRTNSGYTINGSKQFISNARIGKTTILFAVTDPEAGKKGISCFIVANDTPGFSVARVEHKLGQKASDSCALSFDDMQVPDDQRIGAEGEGLKIALATLESGRIGIAAQSVGMARAALDYAIQYAKERKQFGRPIIEHQAVGFRLVEAKTRLAAARELTLRAARLKDAGQPALEAAAMAKLFASEAAEAICSAAIQTLGGYGYLADYPVERIYRDVRVCQIYEGTSDVQKIILQRML